jgi:hypothetical protein
MLDSFFLIGFGHWMSFLGLRGTNCINKIGMVAYE